MAESKVIFAFSDLISICKRNKNKIRVGIALFSILGLLYAVTRPIEYIAEASFREKANSQSGIAQPSITSFFLTGMNSGTNSEAVSMMKSRVIMESLIKKLNLQANVEKRENQFQALASIRNNLTVAYAQYKGVLGPILQDDFPDVMISDLTFNGESPFAISLRFLSEDTFQLIRTKSENNNIGKIGIPFTINGTSFVIRRKSSNPLTSQEYALTFMPIEAVIKDLSGKLQIETDKDDKGLLKLKLINQNRYKAEEILNSLMAVYQNYLMDEQQDRMDHQIKYLNVRHEEMNDKLKQMMDDHARTLALDVATTGFLDANSAMGFFAATQQQYARELLTIERELRRLQQMQQEETLYYTLRGTSDQSSLINDTLLQIHHLKQQADSLDLALREGEIKDNGVNDANIVKQFEKLNDFQNLELDTNTILASLSKGDLPDSSLKLFQDPKYSLRIWHEKLASCVNDSPEKERCLDNFHSYLINLNHLFHVHAKAIQERLTHQRSTPQEFQGIDLNTARELYLNYSRELNLIESNIRQLHFIIKQMQDPEFEISSLSNSLEDEVSQGMIRRASEIVLALHDQDNRSTKEQDRLKSELVIQKQFLGLHLNQTIQLKQLHEQLVREKIQSLQLTTLGLIQQETTVLEEQLSSHLIASVENLSKERSAIELHKKELQQEMVRLPSKWVGEKLIEQQMELNKRMVEEITKLVETKNIASNLEVIQSAPIDFAKLPSQPKPTRLILFTIFGAFAGLLFSLSYVFVNTLSKGIPVTEANLKLSGKKCAGILSKQYQALSPKPLSDHDLDTLRRLGIILSANPSPQTALLVTDGGADYSKDLAMLLSKRGLKVVLLPLSFERSSQQGELPGLLQYLEGKTPFPASQKGIHYDLILSGGVSRFASEMLATQQFRSLLDQLKKDYDWILAVSHSQSISAEAESLSKMFQQVVVSITRQNWQELDSYLNADVNNVSFVINE